MLPDTCDEATLADLLGINAARVRALARDGRLVRSGRGKYDLRESVRRYAGHLREHAAVVGRPTTGGDAFKQAKTRLAELQGERESLRVAKERQELVPAAEVQRAWSGLLRDLRARLLAVPSRCGAALPHLTAHDVTQVDREVRRALEDLADGN